jgi:ribosomal protein S18 acetylase RimI-like enzyme
MTIEIKILGPQDAGVLANVAPDVFDDPIDVVRADEFLADRRHHLVVAVDNGQVVGFVSAVHYLHPDKPRPELWINEVGVATTHQGRGLGKRLLRAVLALAQDLGCAEAWVLTDRVNTAAMRLYAAAGNTEAPTDHVMFTFKLDAGPAPRAPGDVAGTADAEPGAATDRARD